MTRETRFVRACRLAAIIERTVRSAADPTVIAFPVKRTARAPSSKGAAAARVIILSERRAS